MENIIPVPVCSASPAVCVYTHTPISLDIHLLPTVNTSSALLLVGHEHEPAAASPLPGPQILLDMFSSNVMYTEQLGKEGRGNFLHLRSFESYLQTPTLRKWQLYKKEQIWKAKNWENRKLVSFKTSIKLFGAATSYIFNYILLYYTFYMILHYPVHSMNSTLWISKCKIYRYTHDISQVHNWRCLAESPLKMLLQVPMIPSGNQPGF